MPDNRSPDIARYVGLVTGIMAAFAAAGTLFAGPFGAAIGAGVGAIIAGIAIIINAVRSRKDRDQSKQG